jgi:hypothetical protein
MISSIRGGQMPRITIPFQRRVIDIHISGGDVRTTFVLLNSEADVVKAWKEESTTSGTSNERTKPS